ncbi:uncharacterized protein EV420DRAFT_1647406 [Desarmillaria tabescens]|uniref:DUF6534 domain-containing protein n=1 Tax=Armillaria tabescens TaxID=1929756 RepID=A0AA39JVK2_ARMTA|nr:uncharacterized protein EV420DRAFT_1647406 [Desarmillaria tabescens]KAK0448254.1 hypothetical protein EV420DRAFT_1647406 [Desarmillaria tabescens]
MTDTIASTGLDRDAAFSFGPFLVGIIIQQALFGMVALEIYHYFGGPMRSDLVVNKTIVTVLFILNAALEGFDFHVIFRTGVLHFGQPVYIDIQSWTMWMEPCLTASTGFTAQTFFLASFKVIILTIFGHRYWLLTRARGIVVCLGIPGTLILHLLGSGTPERLTSTAPVVQRLIHMSIETSGLTAFLRALNLVLFLCLPKATLHLLVQFSMARVYTLTVLMTLSAQSSLRASLSNDNDVSLSCRHEAAVIQATTGSSLGDTLHEADADSEMQDLSCCLTVKNEIQETDVADPKTSAV